MKVYIAGRSVIRGKTVFNRMGFPSMGRFRHYVSSGGPRVVVSSRTLRVNAGRNAPDTGGRGKSAAGIKMADGRFEKHVSAAQPNVDDPVTAHLPMWHVVITTS